MPEKSEDPVDHARTTRQHAGETMKAGVDGPGLIAVGLVALVVGLLSFASGSTAIGIVGVIVAVLLMGGGLVWLARTHRKVQEKQQDWHCDNPEAHYEPPSS